MSVNIVACINEDYALGYEGDLIYRLSKDLHRFKKITTNSNPNVRNYMVMGRKTYESLGRELANRQHVIITSNLDYRPLSSNTIVTNSLDKVINHYKSGSNMKEMFVIGGNKPFDEALDVADKVYLTLVKDKGKPADTYFNYLKLIKHFEVVDIESDSEDGIEFSFITYERKKIDEEDTN